MKIIDRFHWMHDGLTTHPSHSGIVISDFVLYAFTAPRCQPLCKGFVAKKLYISDNGGANVDVPTHFHEESESIHQQDLDRFFGEAILIDVSDNEHNRPVNLELVKQTLKRDELESVRAS